jgi:hypothetical protein
MKDLIFSFQNLINIFDESESAGKEESPDTAFTPKIHIDGVALESQEWLKQEHINLFDYALKGKIINGQFFGSALFKDENNKVEAVKIQGLNLTMGLHDTASIDMEL